MPAYHRAFVSEFLTSDPTYLLGRVEAEYARDGFASQFTPQTRACEELIPLLVRELQVVCSLLPGCQGWTVLLEFPLYRLQKRIDIVLLAGSTVVVVEAKVGEGRFRAADERQVEEYCLDLRDFHEQSRGRLLVPVLWATEAALGSSLPASLDPSSVAPVLRAGKNELAVILSKLPSEGAAPIDGHQWDSSSYRPVPSVIQAATSIFAGHDVRAIAQADASNLSQAASR